MTTKQKQQIFFAQKGIVFNKEKNALLLLKMDSKYFPEIINGKYVLPGGKVNFGEDIDAGCIREIMEETGVVVSPGFVIHTWGWTYKRDGQDVEIVANARLCKYVTGKLINNEKSEKESTIKQVAWVPFDKINKECVLFDEWPAIEFVLRNIDLARTLICVGHVSKTSMYKGE